MGVTHREELLVTYGQMVMEASAKEDEDKRHFNAHLAEDLLMDTVNVDVELQGTKIGPHTFQRRRGTKVWILGIGSILMTPK